MRTIRCRERLGEQECHRETVPERERAIAIQDGMPGLHYECTQGHRFHLSADGRVSRCDCGIDPVRRE